MTEINFEFSFNSLHFGFDREIIQAKESERVFSPHYFFSRLFRRAVKIALNTFGSVVSGRLRLMV